MQRNSFALAIVVRYSLPIVASIAAVAFSSTYGADTPPAAAKSTSVRVLPDGKSPDDRRLGPLKDLDGYFPFSPPKSPEEWKKRAEQVRRQILVATGLWPMPERTPLNPVIHGKVERGGYTVERVFFASYPGHFVTGSLFRPTGRSGKLPGVLCPYGHWPNGRFYQQSNKDVRQAIANGAERFEVGGQYPLQARCVQLARMGCVVFHYDMVGVADSQQIPHDVSHAHSTHRPQMDTPRDWGFFSLQADLRLQSIMGLQTYNSVRALDFLSELADVDAQRIAVTGASGGGTQTFILGAIDPRPAVAVPVVMVSTAMQGGCPCENCCLLRLGTGNVEFAGLFAPKPLCLIGADDWTVKIATKGGPELKQLYSTLGAKDKVQISPLNQFGHNYNYVTREVMYQWLNRHLGLNLESPVLEEDFVPFSVEELTVWNNEHPKPAGGEDYERSLLRYMTEDSTRQLTRIVPHDEKSLAEFRSVVGDAWKAMIGRKLPAREDVEFQRVGEEPKRADYREIKGLLRNKPREEELPIVVLKPIEDEQGTVIWLDPAGKAGLWGSDGEPRPAVAQALKAGFRVVGVDLLHQGEFLADGKRFDKARLTDTHYNRLSAAYTFGYNPTVFAQRVHDVLTVAAYFADPDADLGGSQAGSPICLMGLNGAGRWAAVAKAVAGNAIQWAAIDTDGFRFANVPAIDDPDFLPGAVKYFDLPGALALCAPGKLWVRDASADEKAADGKKDAKVTAAAYEAAGAADSFVWYDGPRDEAEAAAVQWLLGNR